MSKPGQGGQLHKKRCSCRSAVRIKCLSGDGCFIVGAGRDKGMERWKDGFCNGVIGKVCDVYGGGFCGWRGYGVVF